MKRSGREGSGMEPSFAGKTFSAYGRRQLRSVAGLHAGIKSAIATPQRKGFP